MPVVADASVAIRGDMSGFHRDLKGAETTTTGFAGRLRNLLSPRNVIGAAGVFGIGLGVHEAVRRIGDVIDEYSQLKQAQKTVDDVFGESAEVIEDWADRAADAAGMSRREVSLSASTMGTMLQNMGIDAGTAADTVVTLQQRAADLATAFPGKSAADAMLAFSAALRGERDTVEKFGVTLTQAMIDARIETMNLDTSTPSAERYATAIATLGLIMDQTAGSAGRFNEALEEGDPAALAEALGARVENANAGLAANVEQTLRDITKNATDLGGAVDDFFKQAFDPRNAEVAEAFGISIDDAMQLISDAMYDTGQDYDSTVDDLLRANDEFKTSAWQTYQEVSAAAIAGLRPAKEEAEEVAAHVAEAFIVQTETRLREIRQSGLQATIEYAKGLLDGQNDVKVAIEAALQIMEEEMTTQEELAYLSGQMTTLEHARGVASAEGKRASVIAIDSALALIRERMRALNGEAYTFGENLVLSYTAGMWRRVPAATESAYAIGGAIRAGVGINSEPTDPNSPLRGITKWGGNIVKTIAEGIYGNLGTASGATSALAGALVPSFSGGGMGMDTMGAGQTINYNLVVDGAPKVVGSKDEVLDAWAQMEQF